MTIMLSRELAGPLRSPMRMPRSHVALLAAATMDILITWWILSLGGSEANPIARHVIEHWSLAGTILFKFSLTLFVMLVCEYIAEHQDRTARRLMTAAIAISSSAPCYGIFLLWWHARVLGNSLIPA